MLEAHDWPGNVRELEHCIKQAILLSKGDTVDVECLRLRLSGQRPRSRAGPSIRDLARRYLATMPGLAHQCLMEQAEMEIIREALQHTQGNLARAAKLLGISRPTVREKIARYRLLREVRLVKAPDESLTSLEP